MVGIQSARELLEQLRALSESESIEAKRGGSIGHSILETVCAFSNEPGMGGGHLLLGVVEDEDRLFPSYPVEGVANVDKLQNDLLSQCRSIFNVALAPQIRAEKIEGKVVLVVWVPEAPAAIKPVFFKKDGLPRGAFRRTSSGDVRCTEDDLVVLYEGRKTESYDMCAVEGASWSDIDPDAVEEYRREREKVAPDAEELSWSDEDLLHSLNCAHKEGAMYRPTVAGVLLFGTKMGLRRLFPMMRVDYIRVPGKEWVQDPDNRFVSLDVRDSLFRVVRRVQTAILDDFAEEFSLPEGELQRQAGQVIPSRVLREALVNAVMHRSYRQQAPIQVIRYTNRLEIRNPGFSLKSEERLGEPLSLHRNPALAAVLHETRFAETKGSGVRVMRDVMEKAGLTPPLFESRRSEDAFVFTLLFHHFLGEADWNWLARFKRFNLNDEQARALVWVRESGGSKGAISNAVYRNLNKVDTLKASTELRQLRDLDILQARGKGSATYYVPGLVFLEAQLAWEEERLTLEGNSSSNRGRIKGEGGEKKAEVLPPLRERVLLRNELLELLPVELREEVSQLAPRVALSKMRDLIVRLCQHKQWRAEELALILQRQMNKLVENHLSPLAKQGRLKRTYPELLSHRHQAYWAPPSTESSSSNSH